MMFFVVVLADFLREDEEIKAARCKTDSHTNYCHLNSTEKDMTMHNLHTEKPVMQERKLMMYRRNWTRYRRLMEFA